MITKNTIKNVLEIIEFKGECPYQTFEELLEDEKLIFNSEQKNKLIMVQNLAMDILKA